MRRALGGLVVLVAMACPPVASGAQETFTAYPWLQPWTAPAHVTRATFDVYGGQGATSIYFPNSPGGLGGHATATIDVIPGQTYLIDVGEGGRLSGDPTLPTSEGGEGSEVWSGSTGLMGAGGGGGGPGGGPGGSSEASGGIDGTGSTVSGPGTEAFTFTPGSGGSSYGPPGTAYETGVRSGDGLVIVSYGPETLIQLGPNGLTNDNTPTFSFSSSEAGATFRCVDELTFGNCASPGGTYTTKKLSEGPHTIAVTSTDRAGNSDPTPAIRSFIVDTTPPVVRLTRRPRSTVRTDTSRVRVRVGFKSAARNASFECRLDEEAYRPCRSPFSVGATARPGRGTTHRISVRATDVAGNTARPLLVRFRAIRRD